MLCKDCFIESITDKVLKGIRRNKLIEKGDKVAVALSGGKDSVMVLNIINLLYERNIIDLVAITIDEGIEGYRKHGVELAIKNAERLGIKHRIASIKDYFGKTLDEIMHDESRQHGACTYCGVFRRWIINRVAREEGATKIATGHNLDDETEAILMNYLEGNIDNLTRIGAKSEPKNDKFTVKIKPLREIPEKEVALYVIACELDVHFDECPRRFFYVVIAAPVNPKIAALTEGKSLPLVRHDIVRKIVRELIQEENLSPNIVRNSLKPALEEIERSSVIKSEINLQYSLIEVCIATFVDDVFPELAGLSRGT